MGRGGGGGKLYPQTVNLPPKNFFASIASLYYYFSSFLVLLITGTKPTVLICIAWSSPNLLFS